MRPPLGGASRRQALRSNARLRAGPAGRAASLWSASRENKPNVPFRSCGDDIAPLWVRSFPGRAEERMTQQQRAHLTRERAIEGAAAVFARVGYAAASISDISAETGVSKGSLYFHFSSKEEIARAVLEREQELGKASAERVIAASASSLEASMGLCADFAHWMSTSILARAGVRLTTETTAFDPPLRGPFEDWMPLIGALLARQPPRATCGRMWTLPPSRTSSSPHSPVFRWSRGCSRDTATSSVAFARCGSSSCRAWCALNVSSPLWPHSTGYCPTSETPRPDLDGTDASATRVRLLPSAAPWRAPTMAVRARRGDRAR